MQQIISLIQTIIPQEWLSDFYANEDTGEMSLTIKNPNRSNLYLDLIYINEWVGIASIFDNENIELDLSTFDYSFHQTDTANLTRFLTTFKKIGDFPF